MYHTPIVKNRFERSGFKPIKRRRDKEQALAVCLLVLHFLPHLPFAPDELRMSPKSVVAAAAEAIKASDLPPGYDS